MSIEFGSKHINIGFDHDTTKRVSKTPIGNEEIHLLVKISSASNDISLNELNLLKSERSPKAAYLYLTKSLGYNATHDLLNEFKQRNPFPFELDSSDDNMTSDVVFTREQLLVMALDLARDLTTSADVSNTAVRKPVLTVVSAPAEFDYFDRIVVAKAAEMANLSISKWKIEPLLKDRADFFREFSKLRWLADFCVDSLSNMYRFVKHEVINLAIHFLLVLNVSK
jgi:hypothetical protein